jgi:hypothetical protein
MHWSTADTSPKFTLPTRNKCPLVTRNDRTGNNNKENNIVAAYR